MNSYKDQLIRHKYDKVAPGVWRMRQIFVNIYMIQDQSSDAWVLVDAGLKGFKRKIIKMASNLFGKYNAPACIILTHGHFDHRGSLEALLKHWKVPVYAHIRELPYLTGLSSYPPPDPFISSGLMSLASVFYPREPLTLGDEVKGILDDTIPELPGWKVIETPGHTPGHISLFRPIDKVLIAGDAFVTTKQESAFYTLTETRKLSGPPQYFTPDWVSAEISVRKLASLNPKTAATGHGKPMYGKQLQTKLHDLADHFREIAVPASGRYVNDPAIANDRGIVYIPENSIKNKAITTAALLAAIGSVFLGISLSRRMRSA